MDELNSKKGLLASGPNSILQDLYRGVSLWDRSDDKKVVRRYRIQAIASQLAYDLGVPPSGTEIERAIRAKRPKGTTEASRANTWHRQLQGQRPPNRQTFEEDIAVYSKDAVCIHNHAFWDIYRCQPTTYSDYYILGRNLPIWIEHLGPPDNIKRKSFPFPPDALIKCAENKDSLEHLGYFLLLFGAAHNHRYERFRMIAFKNLVDMACRLACVPPFVDFGDGFVIDVINAALPVGRAAPYNWVNTTKDRMKGYKGLIKQAYAAGLLRKDGQFPQGSRWKELCLLRIAHTEGIATLRAAIDVKRTSGLTTKLYDRLSRHMDTMVAPNNFWDAPSRTAWYKIDQDLETICDIETLGQ